VVCVQSSLTPPTPPPPPPPRTSVICRLRQNHSKKFLVLLVGIAWADMLSIAAIPWQRIRYCLCLNLQSNVGSTEGFLLPFLGALDGRKRSKLRLAEFPHFCFIANKFSNLNKKITDILSVACRPPQSTRRQSSLMALGDWLSFPAIRRRQIRHNLFAARQSNMSLTAPAALGFISRSAESSKLCGAEFSNFCLSNKFSNLNKNT